MIRKLNWMAFITLAVASVVGCAHDKNNPSSDNQSASSSSATTMPASSTEQRRPNLRTILSVDPPVIYINAMPGITPNAPQPKDVKLTLTVHNDARTDYHAVNRDSQVVRFWVKKDGRQVWESSNLALPVETPVDIPAGQTKQYDTTWHVDDARALREGAVVAYAEFVPEHLQENKEIVVQETH